MKTPEYSQFVLNDQETLHMLQGFCYEALGFLKVSADKYPQFAVGVTIQADGKADPLGIEYVHSRISVFIPAFRMMFSEKAGNDAPTMYRFMSYQLARFWYRFLTGGHVDAFNSMDKDSTVFAESLMILKGCRLTPVIPVAEVVGMLKSEFNLECKLDTCFEKNSKQKQSVIRPTESEHVRIEQLWETLREENINRPLTSMAEGQSGSKSNPFANVDEAAAYIQKIEQERLSTDRFRRNCSVARARRKLRCRETSTI